MNIDALHEQLSAEFGGPAIGALPAFPGDVIRPHKGGGGGNSTTTQEVPAELKPLATAYSQKAMALSNQGYQGYDGQQVADNNWWQNTGARLIGDRALGGNSLMNQGQSTMQDALASGNAATSNPYGYSGNVGYAAPSASVGSATPAANGGTNQYAGSNPYLQQNINAAMGDITRNYNDAVAPGLTTQMVNSGSFGNTGAQASTVNALNDLTKNLANTSSGMRMQDYITQQGLAENQINRNMQTSQFNSGLSDSALARMQQNNQFNSSLDESALGRTQQNNQFNAGMGNDYASRNDSMKSQYLNLAPTYGNQAYTDASQLMKVGQQYQDNTQQNLDAQYQNYLDQQNDPYKKLAAMSGVFGSGIGQTSATKSSGGGK